MTHRIGGKHRKFMMSLRIELHEALLDEATLRGYNSIQETIRSILSDWYRNREKKEEKEKLFPHLRA